jgi:hypothetical protein
MAGRRDLIIVNNSPNLKCVSSSGLLSYSMQYLPARDDGGLPRWFSRLGQHAEMPNETFIYTRAINLPDYQGYKMMRPKARACIVVGRTNERSARVLLAWAARARWILVRSRTYPFKDY